MGTLLSLLRSDYKRTMDAKQARGRSTARSSEHRSAYNSPRGHSLDNASNSSGNNNNENERSSREVVFPDSFEVLPRPRADLSVVYMGVSHEQQRKFRCRFCGKGYRWKSTMRRHEKVECGKQPSFQCPQCPYKARQRGNLTVHFKRHHQKMGIGIFDDSA
ncbi:ikaros family zinc finger protein-like [Copidosoma floridanum]|uniref:ikaros family zinc finger protein-like n=1 Tax=Copidosoma floridanum TaxID=29053 RepID=UPI0006C93CE5|nr:ikaros family zinc finger protein-like [Copidosoma floridanum]